MTAAGCYLASFVVVLYLASDKASEVKAEPSSLREAISA